MVKAQNEVVGLPTPRDRFLYDPSKAKLARYLLYLADRLLIAWRGLRLARRHRVELVFCEDLHRALSGLLIARIRGLRCVWDSHGSIGIEGTSTGAGRVYVRLATALERFLGKRVDVLLTVTDADREAYVQMGVPPAKVHVLPLTIDLGRLPLESSDDGRPRSSTTPPTLLFFGSFQYAPNLEALEFLNTHLAPHLEAKGIACTIWVAGRDVPPWTFHPSIKVLGFVPDLHETIRAADLCVVPVWHGGGTLTKVLDAMAVGTPTVLSSLAASGFSGIEDGVHALVADSEEAFLNQVERALGDPKAGRAMARQARHLIEGRHDQAVQQPVLQALLQGESSPTPASRSS